MSPSDGDPRASLIVGSEMRELSRVSAWIQDWAKSQRLPTKVAQKLDLCSTEVVTNIMNYACSEGAQHIHLHLGWQGEDVALEVEDEGSQFDPRQVPEPARATDVRDARIGGWGIPILRRFSDDLRYRHEDGRNCLTLLFRAEKPP
jgi:serine/threonine-protein kinase RsbW